MRLSQSAVGALPATVALPRYDRTANGVGIVHLGFGAFHRAHQAVYTDDALAAGDRDWAILGVSLRSSGARSWMDAQNGFYTVVERSAGAHSTRLVASVARVIVAPDDPDAVVAALADASTHVVTLTVTEKGYHRRPGTDLLAIEDAGVAAEIAGGAPTTIYGYLAAALRIRRAAAAGPLTLVSCDNLSSNGRLLAALLDQFLGAADPDLRGWARNAVACVDTMVDRIVPAVTDATIAAVEAELGVRDEGVVVTEPFRQWVIEDRFAGRRPRWEAGGALFVSDVAPFELAKLRLLNGSHSTLAYAGLQLGHVHVHEAVADPDLGRFIAAQMRREAGPSLPDVEGLDVSAYIGAILERFGNADLPHRLAQIATDGSQKIPQRWIATIIDRRGQGLNSPLHLTSLAAWIARTRHPSAAVGEESDPLAEAFRTIWRDAGPRGDGVVEAFHDRLGVLPSSLMKDPASLAALRDGLTDWLDRGPRATLRATLDEVGE